ncbi:MAG: hypothetical protein Q8K60_05275 [Parachlamydiaceae bacterium]|nr:hypothetical protein [Parachlamydiaceae bacterium]
MIATNNLLIYSFGGLVAEGLAIYKKKPTIKTGAQIFHHVATILPIIAIVAKKLLADDKSYLDGFLKNVGVGLTLGVTGVIILSPLAPFFREKGYLGSYCESENEIKYHNFTNTKEYHDHLVNHYTKLIHQLMIVVSIAELAFAIYNVKALK